MSPRLREFFVSNHLNEGSGAAADEALGIVEPESVLAFSAFLREEIVAQVERELASAHRLAPVGQALLLLKDRQERIQSKAE